MLKIENFRKQNVLERIAITKHAKERLKERNIKVDDIINAIDTGRIIKDYEDDKPLPSCLVLGKSLENRFLHIVVSMDNDYIYLITAYYPSNDQWEADFITRKER